ncbi:hypothetical protein MY3296_007111 [Beauveria thailandica]
MSDGPSDDVRGLAWRQQREAGNLSLDLQLSVKTHIRSLCSDGLLGEWHNTKNEMLGQLHFGEPIKCCVFLITELFRPPASFLLLENLEYDQNKDVPKV